MGIVASAVRAEAKKQTEEVQKETNDALNSLIDLAKVETALFKYQVKDTSDKMRIKVSKFIREDTLIKCKVDYDGTKLAKHVAKVYKSFANQDVANALGEALGAALEGLFGSAVANSNQETRYFITVGKLGYPYRVDMHLYTYQFTCKTLTTLSKNVIAISMIISSVDLSDVTESDLGTIVQVCYADSSEDSMKKILAKLKEVRKDQIKEKKGESTSGSGSTESTGSTSKAALKADGQGLDGGKYSSGFSDGGGDFQDILSGNGNFPKKLLDFETIEKESHEAWKEAMEEEEALPSYQPPEISDMVSELLKKLG